MVVARDARSRRRAPRRSDRAAIRGLDTFAEVYLDGTLLGRADNMFRSWCFDLADVAAGRHDLALCFHPTALVVAGPPLPAWSSFTDRINASRRTLMRKAQFGWGWGWDWGPDLPTVGIWKPVRLVRRQAATIRSLGFSTLSIVDGMAAARVDIDMSAAAQVTIELLDPDGAAVATATRHGSGTVAIDIPDARLWWTADLGAQPLYTLTAKIDGAPEFARRVGIRTIAIDQSPDPEEPGTTFFRFVLNGVPIFAKGANWVPASSYVGAVPDGRCRDLLERAVSANMNIIRVWGGGIYEPDCFYDECDRLGLLVWQDFMFACAPYPDDAAFIENVRAEVAEQVARLRHHACLALWCGNNENQAIQFFEDHATGTTTPLAGLAIYDEVIPEILAGLDPLTPYWPGSPWGGPSPNSMRGGDVHNWTVWHGVPPVPDTHAVGHSDRSPEGIAFSRPDYWWQGAVRERDVSPPICVDPVNWRADGVASAAENPGSLPFPKAPFPPGAAPLPPLAKNLTGAACNTPMLEVQIPSDAPSGFRDKLSALLGIYHANDYGIFYGSIRRNAIDRTQAWLAAHKAQPHR